MACKTLIVYSIFALCVSAVSLSWTYQVQVHFIKRPSKTIGMLSSSMHEPTEESTQKG